MSHLALKPDYYKNNGITNNPVQNIHSYNRYKSREEFLSTKTIHQRHIYLTKLEDETFALLM